MAEQQTHLNPMSGFILSEGAKLTDYDRTVIYALYQPILGPDATILLTTFWNLLTDEPMLSERMLHTELMNIVNLAPQAILAARGRLEALNLMQTWHNNDALGEYFIYELHAPLLPQQFFMDDLMSVLLLNAVGPKYYQSLQQRFKLRQLATINGDDISQKITDIFTINSETFKTVSKLTIMPDQRNQRAELEESDLINEASKSFDFELLFDALSNTGIRRDALMMKRNLFYSLHQTFGINELSLSQVIRQTMTFDTQEINDEQLKQKVVDMFANAKTGVSKEKSLAVTKVNPKPSVIKEPKNKAVAQFLSDARELKPLEFLQSIKVQRNGYPTSNEIKTITDVVEKNVLPLQVINSLIFYVLMSLGRDNINRAYFNSIANTLSQNRLTDAYQALKFLANYQREKEKKQTKPFSGNGVYKKVESKPVYKQPQPQTVSKAQVEATKERLARLKESRLNQADQQGE